VNPHKIVDTIKKELKRQGMTYANLADALGLSEPAIKRMFSIGDFSIGRLGEICSLLNLNERDFFRSLVQEERLPSLNEEQEIALAEDIN